MDKLGTSVAELLETRLVGQERVEGIFESLLARRKSRAAQAQIHVTDLNRPASEAVQRLARLYEAIETGIADLDDLNLKDRVAHIKTLRDETRAEMSCAEAGKLNATTITPRMIEKFSIAAR